MAWLADLSEAEAALRAAVLTAADYEGTMNAPAITMQTDITQSGRADYAIGIVLDRQDIVAERSTQAVSPAYVRNHFGVYVIAPLANITQEKLWDTAWRVNLALEGIHWEFERASYEIGAENSNPLHSVVGFYSALTQ